MPTKSKNDPCEGVLAREQKLERLEKIYTRALNTMFDALKAGSVDKDAVYAAAQAIQTASREIGIIERVVGLNAPGGYVLTWDMPPAGPGPDVADA